MSIHKSVFLGAVLGLVAGLMYLTAPISGTLILVIGVALFNLIPVLGNLSVLLAVVLTYAIYCGLIFSVLGYCQWRSNTLSEMGVI